MESSLTSSGNCVRCGSTLAPERFAQCEPCDEAVAIALVEYEVRASKDRVAQLFRESCLPPDTWDRAVPGTADAVDAQEILRGGRGLLLTGPGGIGKTYLASALLTAWIRAESSGKYVSVPALFAAIHASYNGSGSTVMDIIRPLVESRCLVLDDLGKERATEHAASVILQILDGRLNRRGQGRWLIITSNLDPTALCARFAHLGSETVEPIQWRIDALTVAVAMTGPVLSPHI